MIGTTIERIAPANAAEPPTLLKRVEVHAESLLLLMPVALLASLRSRLEPNEMAEADAANPTLLRLNLPVRMHPRGGRNWVVGCTRPASRSDPALIKALRTAHAMLTTDTAGLPTLDAAPATSYRRRLVRLAFLAPELQRDILAGRQPPGLTLESLMRARTPTLWSGQKAAAESFGLTGAPAVGAHRSN